MSHKNGLFGLTTDQIRKIIEVLKSFPEVERGAIFGSRALGTYKKGSDVDIILHGKFRDETVTSISYQLNEEGFLPYFFDVLDYNEVDNPALKDHIDRVAITFYSSKKEQ